MLHLVRKLFAQRGGATLVEYAFITAVISIIAITAIIMIGTQLNIVFGNIGTALISSNAN